MIHPDAVRTYRGVLTGLAIVTALFWLPLAALLIGATTS